MSEREKEVLNIGMGNMDMRPYSVVLEMKSLLGSLVDEGTSMDSGTMDGEADMYATIGGREYSIIVRASKAQIAKESSP